MFWEEHRDLLLAVSVQKHQMVLAEKVQIKDEVSGKITQHIVMLTSALPWHVVDSRSTGGFKGRPESS